jgi:pyruvate,orthophosphate dikinase
MMEKYVYFFGNKTADGSGKMKELLGGKGANLAEMANIGIPVPPGFTISTEVCTYYYKNNNKYPDELESQVKEAIKNVEEITGKKFGSIENPLLFSVRSGARVSMPGMMDTVLNLGLNDKSVQGLAKQAGNERFSFDSYRRFIQMYGNVVKGIDSEKLEKPLEEIKKKRGVKLDTELTADDLKELVVNLKITYKELTGEDFPQNPEEQLWESIGAVFGSWNNQRAITYRKLNGIPDEWGTAVNVQSMVFGNLGEDSATGVAFTRDPATGEKKFFGEFLVNAQGEDVVAGIRTPNPINETSKNNENKNLPTLEQLMPESYKELVEIYLKLENHYRDMQDIEFTIEKGKLWMLQTRNGKRTAKAAVKIAVDMVKEGLIDKKEAIMRVEPSQLDQLLHPMLDPKADKKVIARGLPASPGAAAGKIVFSADEAEKLAGKGEKVILVRIETSPEDIHGMNAAEGILTARGGMTSHAAVVARGMGKCCVSGCSAISVDNEKQEMKINSKIFKKGDVITLDGSTGEVIEGEVPRINPEFTGEFGEFMKWVDEVRVLGVRTNADTPHDSEIARKFGAEGIGLCRTEHMFFEGDRIIAVREMILSETKEEREKALEKVKPYQKEDFKGIFKEMNGLPVTIRLLDPPLHEFLPKEEKEMQEVAKNMNVSVEKIKELSEKLHEFNPMLGHRGCRLGITFPEIYEMQVRAIMEAACECIKEGIDAIPEIMIPLVGLYKELEILKNMTNRVADEVIDTYNVKIEYKVGTMIELPRAALTADEIARFAEFFSFGTNDLTQTTFGFSRDDAGKFLKDYVDIKILPKDPFVTLDIDGVGQLVEMGVKKGKATRPDLKVGICGEHGGDPESVYFCHKIGMTYVSCSPYRVPIARLAAAQAAILYS